MDPTYLYAKQLAAVSPHKLFRALNLSLKDRGAYWTSSCPVHGGDNDRAFTLYKGTLNWICHTHNCQGNRVVGDIFSLISLVKKITYREAMTLLRVLYEVGEVDKEILDKVEFEYELRSFENKDDQKKRNGTLPCELIDMYAAHQNDYYLNRGYSKDLLTYFQVGFCPETLTVPKDLKKYTVVKNQETGIYEPYFKNRMVIPIHSPTGDLIGFTGRTVMDIEPKFIHTYGMLKNLTLYNWHRAEKYMNGEIILVESPGVAWAWWRAGYLNVVASMGCMLSKEQACLIARHPKISRVIIAYDADAPGRAGTEQAAKMLYGKTNILRIEPEEEVDYDSLNKEDIQGHYNKRKVYT